jgi:ketosteroid isomerase-like protein
MTSSETHQVSTSAANQALIERAYDAFARGDVPTVLEALAENILWHVPGRGLLSRDYNGHAEVLGFFQRFVEVSEGTFRIVVDDVLTKGDRVIVLVTESARRHGRE